ncbi:DUF2793 domain-containing protein [Rhizobium sp. SL42]|uniref:DUF2793 domain-containing protein n=1 Tax=Rhizobium sp. SL42 TaxID=2806346 RepID=UPI001F1639DD|nr:DUF2793 domain-containing protein [Rhizobium sp. SL42]UJW74502.1 DUF2793 domain-containing protein [Rhizobium sp. SL42]
MSDTTSNLDLPFILPAQAQKHVTHNEALQRLDALVQLVIQSEASEPPPAPSEGDVHWLLAPAGGVWSGREGHLALYQDAAWLFIAPRLGWRGYIASEQRPAVFDGAEWIALPLPSTANFDRLGIAATPDGSNRLAISSPASLFNHAGASHRLTVNKQSEDDTASLLFQSNWQGRAEMGLAGEDRFSIKVNSDVTGWRQAIGISPEGYVRLDQRPLARAALAAATLTPASGTATGFDLLHLSGGGVTLGLPLASGFGKPLLVPATGFYLLALTVTANSSGSHSVALRRNGGEDLAHHTGGAGTSTVVTLAWLDSGDAITLLHNSTTEYVFGYGRTELNLMLL